jgi:hypothetical protein
MVRTVLAAVVMVVVFAVVMMLAVVLTVMMAGRVVGAMLGDGGSGAPNDEGQCDGERSGYARYELHSAS